MTLPVKLFALVIKSWAARFLQINVLSLAPCEPPPPLSIFTEFLPVSLAYIKAMVSPNITLSTMDSNACLLSSSFNPQTRNILTHLSTLDTLSRHVQMIVRLHTGELVHPSPAWQRVNNVALPHHGECLDLLEQVHQGDVVDSVI